MFALMIVRYLLKVEVSAVLFLAVSMLPIWWGTTTEQMAFIASCIPLSIAFQYKYAFLILTVAMLIRCKGRLKTSGVLLIVTSMMVWELVHAFYGQFSYVEYLRDFAELLLLGIITSIDLHNVDHKLVIRSLSVSVVGVCVIMLIMQLQQFNFNLVAVFARSAASFRFGQSNMESGTYALNFNANNLGFICNLATCGCLLLIVRKEHRWTDVVCIVCTIMFAFMTLSRSAIICMVAILGAFILFIDGNFHKRIWSAACGVIAVILVFIFMQQFVPSIFENISERFQRSDITNGRSELFQLYSQFLLSSPIYFLFGVGVQCIFEKVARYYPVIAVPHMGIQEIWLAWGIVGVAMMLVVFYRIITTSKHYAGGKRTMYQFMPFILTLVFTTSGQLLTSSRALMALIFAYICLCVKKSN